MRRAIRPARSAASARSRARFPGSASVRFHLGVLLLWQGDVKAAKRQLRLARAAEPGSRIADEAERYLQELGQGRDRLSAKIGLTAYGVPGELLARFHNFARKVLRFLRIATTVSAIGGGAEVSAGGTD